MADERFVRRLQMMNTVVAPALKAQTSVLVKDKYFTYAENVDKVFRFITMRGTDYIYNDGIRHNKNDGIVLTPDAQPYLCGPNTLFKWKWESMNTIDFVIERRKLEEELKKSKSGGAGINVDLNVATRDDIVKATTATLSVEEATELLRSGRETQPEAVVECAYNRATGTWHIERHRPDKNSANFSATAFQTMEVQVDRLDKTTFVNALHGAVGKS
eukprot:Plantae.Rhodophyta-Rhodochaete_pulchella.ctg71810.p1 GENE.Plantae.Rhodophyta-Rhodochaete_pulchella.ctg71810~~Plantae.Rhodophyta-Rhodochaete_pulchella.ctg71810.p1  ORF type:complete len:240 (+),score=41.26 Plantae.Rhodophyta-Rhodochaete_pulchella.ctg71810:73-720(+)